MKKAILITVIVIVVLAGCGLACYHTNLYTEFEKSRIEKQLGKIYGTDFEVKSIDEPQSLFPKFGASQGFTAYSREGIFTLGECDWKGTVLTDTYCHYFYAPALNLELQNIICDCFEDFYIVRDCLKFGGNKAAVDLVAVHSVVQCHHEHTLIGKALVLSGSVPPPCNLSPRNLRHSEIPHFLLWRPLGTVPHCDSFSAGTCHFCGVQYQSDSLTLLSWTWKLPRAVTFSQCYSVCSPNHWATGSFSVGF